MKHLSKIAAVVLSGTVMLCSCNMLEVTMPRGPQGEQGASGMDGSAGKDGLSAYDVWVLAVKEGKIDYSGPTGLEDFFLYLKGKDGRDGKDGKDGKDGLDGKDGADGHDGTNGKDGADGLSAYELWQEYVASGVGDPHNEGTQWDQSKTSMADFYWFLTGKDGDDGNIPYVGENGDWWIGDADTGIPARGEKGEKGDQGEQGEQGATGAQGAAGLAPHIGGNGNWFIGKADTGVPARGKDGADGKDGSDGKDGADGKDGSDGLSAYALWKRDVTSAEGLENPANGVYDVNDYPSWPKEATSIGDFWLYLRGKDGDNGNVEVKIALYDENVIHGLFNLAPVIAMKTISYVSETEVETTYETVNPITGGAAFIVTGQDGSILPGCEVTFTDMTGSRSYSKTSDDGGYIYLTRDELPEYKAGDPSGFDRRNAVKPSKFVFAGRTIEDPDLIAKSCIVPYQVGLEFRQSGFNKPVLGWNEVTLSGSISRIVEGKEKVVKGRTSPKTSVEAVPFPKSFSSSKTGKVFGYFQYLSKSDSATRAASVAASTAVSEIKNRARKGAYSGMYSNYTFSKNAKRPVATTREMSNEYFSPSYGDGPEPRQVSVHHTWTIDCNFRVDYGLSIRSNNRVHIPEIAYSGGLDPHGDKGGPAPCVSYNGMKVRAGGAETDSIPVKRTNYELILGQTSFSFVLDPDSFPQCYLCGSGSWEGDTFYFKRYANLQEWAEDLPPISIPVRNSSCGILRNTGSLNGSAIDNTVPICFDVTADRKIVFHGAGSPDPSIIRNVYDGFSIRLMQTAGAYDYLSFYGRDGFFKVHYLGISGEFSYEDGSHVASCTLNGNKYDFQTIVDGRSTTFNP